MKYFVIIGIFLSVLFGVMIAELEPLVMNWNSDLEFSHKFHIEDNEVECESCHPDAMTSTTGKDDLLPKEEACMECHEKSDETCSQCHSSKEPKALPRVVNYSPKFSHKKHIDEGVECLKCHSGVETKESVRGMHIPQMDKCMGCHELTDNVQDCYLCHTEDESLTPQDHTEIWKNTHGSFSESSGKDCSTCHQETYCQNCHLGENLMSESHPPDFIMTHSFSYLMRESDCASCHGGVDYCIQCHMEAEYVVPMSHNSSGWGSLYEHPVEAKANMDLCVVCHTAADQEKPSCSSRLGCHNK